MTLALKSEFVALLKKDFRKSAAPVFDATKLPGSENMHPLRHRRWDDISRAMEALEQASAFARIEFD